MDEVRIMDAAIIDAYEKGAAKVRPAVAGLTPAQLKAIPVPGTWSIQQIVPHLMDSELIGANRMKKIIAMDLPLLMSYDETRFSQNLHYHEQSVEDALTILELHGRQMARILRQLPESAFSREAIHSEVGKITLGWFVERMIGHTDHHLKFIHKKRKMIEKAK
jgi:hypothetical protein